MLTSKLRATTAEPSLPLVQKSKKSLHLGAVLMPQNAVRYAEQRENRQHLKVKVWFQSDPET